MFSSSRLWKCAFVRKQDREYRFCRGETMTSSKADVYLMMNKCSVWQNHKTSSMLFYLCSRICDYFQVHQFFTVFVLWGDFNIRSLRHLLSFIFLYSLCAIWDTILHSSCSEILHLQWFDLITHTQCCMHTEANKEMRRRVKRKWVRQDKWSFIWTDI